MAKSAKIQRRKRVLRVAAGRALTMSTSYTDALCLDLEAEGPLVLPQGRRDAVSASHGQLRAVLRCRGVAG